MNKTQPSTNSADSLKSFFTKRNTTEHARAIAIAIIAISTIYFSQAWQEGLNTYSIYERLAICGLAALASAIAAETLFRKKPPAPPISFETQGCTIRFKPLFETCYDPIQRRRVLINYEAAKESCDRECQDMFSRLQAIGCTGTMILNEYESIIQLNHSFQDTLFACTAKEILPSSCIFFRYKKNIMIPGKDSDFNLENIVEPNKHKSLLMEADAYAKQKSAEYVRCNLSENASSKQLISQIYSQFDGICIGETHSQNSPKQWIQGNLSSLYGSGVRTLFLEHLFYDSIQEELDRYFSSQSDEMPPMLEASLRRIDTMFSENSELSPTIYTNLVRAAKKAGIRVVALDTTLSYQCGMTGFGATGPERIKAMNYVAARIIEHEKRDGKYIALVGSYHGVGFPETEGYPGLAELVKCPFVIVEDTKEESKIQIDIKNVYNQIPRVHALIQQHV